MRKKAEIKKEVEKVIEIYKYNKDTTASTLSVKCISFKENFRNMTKTIKFHFDNRYKEIEKLIGKRIVKKIDKAFKNKKNIYCKLERYFQHFNM